MKTTELYRYKREDGGVDVSPIKPDGEFTKAYRLIADEGKSLTKDGVDFYYCVDVDDVEGWYEVDEPEGNYI